MTTYAVLLIEYIPVDILKLIEQYLVKYDPIRHTYDTMARSGNLQGIQWLYANKKNSVCTSLAMDFAATNGHFKIVKWLHEHSIYQTMNSSVYNNRYMGVNKFLYISQRLGGCTRYAMDGAAENGYLEIVQWLHTNRNEGCTHAAMDFAAQNGHLEIVQWLHENRTEGCTRYAMTSACQNGHLTIAQWLHENRTEGCTRAAMDMAIRGGYLEIVEFICTYRAEGCSRHAPDYAAWVGNLPILAWLYKNYPYGCSDQIYSIACVRRHQHILRWLSTNCNGEYAEINNDVTK